MHLFFIAGGRRILCQRKVKMLPLMGGCRGASPFARASGTESLGTLPPPGLQRASSPLRLALALPFALSTSGI